MVISKCTLLRRIYISKPNIIIIYVKLFTFLYVKYVRSNVQNNKLHFEKIVYNMLCIE
jgi:hypothetical protein